MIDVAAKLVCVQCPRSMLYCTKFEGSHSEILHAFFLNRSILSWDGFSPKESVSVRFVTKLRT